MVDDTRAYYTFYGIDTDDYSIDWGSLSNHHSILVKNFISEDTSCTSSIAWTSSGTIFLYPHNIKKTYYLEGVVEGQLTFTSDNPGVISFVSDYRVSIIKIGNDGTETQLVSTGVIVVNDEIDLTDNYKVYPFWIDVFDEAKEITENERIGIKIEWDVDNSSSATAYLSHENWAQGEDVKITFPFIL